MTIHRHWPVALVLLCCASLLHAKLPNDRFLPLYKDIKQKRLEAIRAAGSGAYMKVGHHDPKWDAKAAQYLQNADVAVSDYYMTELSPQAFRALGDEVLKLGCNDPVILFHQGLHAFYTGSDGQPLIDRAYKAFDVHPYPPLRRALLDLRLFECHVSRRDQQAAGAAANKLVNASTRALCRDEAFVKDRMLVVDIFFDLINHEEHVADPLYRALAGAKNVDAAALIAVEGLNHIKTAWRHRGGGWASEVTPEGWKKFAEHLNLAKEKLTAAWEADPKLPHVCKEMIAVSMGLDDEAATRLWFERSVVACFDYEPSYSAYLWSIYPRWGGSIRKMMDLGAECVETGRFDTDVPWFMVHILDVTRQEMNGEMAHYAEAHWAAAIEELFRGYMKVAPNEANRNAHRSSLAAFAARAGHWDVARREIVEANDTPMDGAATWRAYYAPEEIVARAYANTGPAGDIVARAGQAYLKGDLDEAIKLYDEAAAAPQDHASASRFLKSAAKGLRWQRDFAAGKTVDITPDADLTGWQPQFGEWAVEQGVVVCKKAAFPAKLICLADFGTSWEMTIEVDPVKADRSSWGVAALQNSSHSLAAVLLKPVSDDISITGIALRGRLKLDAKQTLTITRVEGRLTIKSANQLLLPPQPIPFIDEAVERVALFQMTPADPPGARFTKVQIRRN